MKIPTLRTALGVGFVALLVNTGYIAAFASPTIPYMLNVLIHLVLGIGLAAGLAALLARDGDLRRQLGVAALAFAVALALGLYLTIWGNVRDHQWALRGHIVAAAIGVIALLPLAWRAARSVGRARTFGFGLQGAAVFAVAFPLVVGVYVRTHPNPTDRIRNPH